MKKITNFRKNLFCIFLTLILSIGFGTAIQANDTSSVPLQTFNYVTYFVVNCNQSITLRQAADVNSAEICQIPFGAAVSYIEGAPNGFYKIVYNGTTGYALASYLSTTPPTTLTVPSISTNYITYYVVNCKQSITLRISPSTSAAEICQIPLGAAVSYVGTAQNGFYQVIYNGRTGYALASYLSVTPQSYYYDNVYYEPYFETYYVVNCNESITLRTSPSTSAAEICQIPLGAAVTFYSNSSNGFYYVNYNGYIGYALASYLTSASSWSATDTCRVVNCQQSITLRTNPNTTAAEICQIPLGDTVTYVSNIGNGFYEIYYLGKHGYAMAYYLQFL